jgi:hypothetical protein
MLLPGIIAGLNSYWQRMVRDFLPLVKWDVHPSIQKCCPQCPKYLLRRCLDPKVFGAVGNMKKSENRHFVLRGKKELWLTWLGPAAKRWMFIISSSISLTRELQPRITGSTKLYQQTTDKTISNHVPVLLRDWWDILQTKTEIQKMEQSLECAN